VNDIPPDNTMRLEDGKRHGKRAWLKSRVLTWALLASTLVAGGSGLLGHFFLPVVFTVSIALVIGGLTLAALDRRWMMRRREK